MEIHASHIDYLRAKMLWDHLQDLSVASSDVSQEISDGLTYASALSLLGGLDGIDDGLIQSIGGITSNDVARYGEQRHKLSQKATDALSERLDRTLKDVALYYHAAEDLGQEDLHSLALSLDDDTQVVLTRKDLDLHELSSHLDTILDLYQEAAEVHPRLETSLDETIQTLPRLVNANQSASHDLLALAIETSLLKLSVLRARIRASLYGYASSNPRATMSNAVSHLQEKLVAQQRALDAQERDVRARLQDYQQLLELVDGEGGGFTQVVEDLTTVRRETEDCRKDLRRLGWTEN